MPQAGNPQSFNRYSYTLNNPQNYIDPSGFFFSKLFKKIFSIFNKVLPVVAPVQYLTQTLMSKLPRQVFGGLQIVIGAVQLYYGNPWGLAQIASGAMSFGRSNGWQYASMGVGIIGTVGSIASGWGGQGTSDIIANADATSSATGGTGADACIDCAAGIGSDDIHSVASNEGEHITGGTGQVRVTPRVPGARVSPTQYVTLPNGRVVPIPQGWEGRVADNGRGLVFQDPAFIGKGDASSIRIMDPNRLNPHGYIKFTDSNGYALNVNGTPVSPNSAAAHIPLNYKGQVPALWRMHGRTP